MSATSKGTKVRSLRKASFRWRFPDRTLHVVDVENLAGAAIPSLYLVSEVQIRYVARLGFGADDHVVLATSHLGLLNAGLGWPHARHLVRSGKDGADLELIDVLEHENVATRVPRHRGEPLGQPGPDPGHRRPRGHLPRRAAHRRRLAS